MNNHQKRNGLKGQTYNTLSFQSLTKGFRNKCLFYFQQLLSFGYNFQVWQEGWSSWQFVNDFNLDDLIMKNTSLHREILPNEWVFDLDGNNWQSVYELALNLEELFVKYSIIFNRWSSGNYLHYHVFLDESEIVKTKPTWFRKLLRFHFKELLKKDKVLINELILLWREIHRAIPLTLIRELPKVENASIDLQKFNNTKCLIRAESSLNQKTKAYKTYLNELPHKQILIKERWKVNFPEKILVWKPDPKFYYNLFLITYWNFVKPRYKIEITEKKVRTKHKITWIEKILENTFHDGRKRLLDLIILPYLVTIKGLDPENTFNLALDWALRNHNVEPIRINGKIASHSALKNYICYRVKRIERRGFKPL
jgi:hypothetical protein